MIGINKPEDYSYAIIAPYKAQEELLRYFLSELKYPSKIFKRISINSVDAFQGQERDIVFTSDAKQRSRYNWFFVRGKAIECCNDTR